MSDKNKLKEGTLLLRLSKTGSFYRYLKTGELFDKSDLHKLHSRLKAFSKLHDLYIESDSDLVVGDVIIYGDMVCKVLDITNHYSAEAELIKYLRFDDNQVYDNINRTFIKKNTAIYIPSLKINTNIMNATFDTSVNEYVLDRGVTFDGNRKIVIKTYSSLRHKIVATTDNTLGLPLIQKRQLNTILALNAKLKFVYYFINDKVINITSYLKK